MEPQLLLFDIDGTLLTSGGAGEHALRLGFHDAFGIDDNLRTVEIAGRTDSGIARQMLRTHGLPETPQNFVAFYEGYLSHLPDQLSRLPGRLLPGVLPLLKALQSRSDVVLALLTGNLARGAELKLRYYGIWHFFKFGAYADDHHDRNELGAIAQSRAAADHGLEFTPERITVLGDTPHDIACARAIGARVLAVTTGRFSRDELAAFQPDVILDDLSDLPTVLAALQLS